MTTPLTFGYLYDFRNPAQWRRPWADLYAETLDVITWTESLGFQGAWVPEHHGAEDGYAPSPLVTLGAIAARTRTIKLGSAIALRPSTTLCGLRKSARCSPSCPTPIRDQIPLYIGGFSDKALERSAKYGDGYFGNEEVCDLCAGVRQGSDSGVSLRRGAGGGGHTPGCARRHTRRSRAAARAAWASLLPADLR